MKQETIDIKSLTIGYKTKNRTRIVASGINTKLYSGELTCLIGANGVGKSTLLKTLSCFISKIEGSVNILGKEIESYSEQEISTTIGVVLTDKCSVQNMSVRELVSTGRSPYTDFWGRLGKNDEEIVSQSIKEVGIENLAEKRVEILSDGEHQKVMIAKALAQDTPIIFLDEPTAFLDFSSKVEMLQLLHHLSRERSKSIFVSTHDLELAIQIADRLWLMDEKSGITVGTPEDLSLQGVLSRFFTRREIKCHSKIKLTGGGQKYSMIKKALKRNGIEASKNIESVLAIDSGDDMSDRGIVIYTNENESVEVDSIDAMLDLVVK